VNKKGAEWHIPLLLSGTFARYVILLELRNDRLE
jgi:hypothetical protein